MHSLLSIRPSDEAAAVCTIPPLHPNYLKCSTKPTTVNGLTIPDAAEVSDTS